jgi:hypothetical protein
VPLEPNIQHPISYDFGIHGVKVEHFESILPEELAQAVREEVPRLRELNRHRNSSRRDAFFSVAAGTRDGTPYRYSGAINQANRFPRLVEKVLQWLNKVIGKRCGIKFNCGVINYYPPSAIKIASLLHHVQA